MQDQDVSESAAISRLAPVRRRASWRGNSSLPASLTSFVGREREITALAERLSEARLLTLTGVGGIGKSRLALEVARSLEAMARGRVCLVELAAITEPNGVVASIATALGVQERGDRPLLDGIVASLTEGEVLLVLDNCEQLVETVVAVTLDLQRRCPNLRVLVTSRIPLELDGEAVWQVEPLAVPDLERLPARAALARSPAVRLFVERARAARADFVLGDRNAEDVARICARLDGIPLAIELAAARVNVLSAAELVRRLDDRFRLLTSESRTVLPRHRTLRASIDWSYDLLDTRERILFRRLAVFVGGWTLEAAEAVCADDRPVGLDADPDPLQSIDRADVLDLLARLVARSLVQTDHTTGEPRFRLLETIRTYALVQLCEAGEELALRQRHLEWVAVLADRADTALWTAEQRAWLERLDAELDNVRAALTWSDGSSLPSPGLQIVARLWRFWEQRGRSGEARAHLKVLLGRPDGNVSPSRPLALTLDAYFAHLVGDLDTARTRIVEALALTQGAADPVARVCALLTHAILTGTGGDLAGAQAVLEEGHALAQAAGWAPGVRMTLVNLSIAARVGGDEDRAAALLEESRALAEAAGDGYTEAFCLTNLAHLAYQRGDWDVSADRYRQALAHWRDLHDAHNAAMALEGLAWAVSAQQHAASAARLFGAAQGLRELVGTALLPHWQAEHDRARAATQTVLGVEPFAAAWAEGRAMTAEQAFGFGLATPDMRVRVGRAALRSGDTTRPPLSPRETQVARLVARGLTNRQIAATLVLQESTVGNHLQRIYARLGLNGRAHLVAWLAAHSPDDAPHLY